jgi:hypothetical protein
MQHSFMRIGAIATLVAASATLAGCTFGNRGVIGSRSVNPLGNVTYNTDNGTGSINFSENGINITGTGEDAGSSVSFGGQSLPDNWPSDLATPSNGTLVFSGSSTDNGTTSFSASFSVNGSAGDVLSDMKSKYQSAGWEISGEFNSTYSGVASAGFSITKGENSGSVIIGTDSADTSKTSVTLGAEYK